MIYRAFLNWEDIIKNINIYNNSLLVIDIDNTLIKTKTDLGSDQFFDWQMKEISNDGSLRLASSKENLLKIMYKLWNYVQYELCDENIPDLLKGIKDVYNIDIILLTSRNDICNETLIKVLINLNIYKLLNNNQLNRVNYNGIIYKNGIIYCNGKDKGLCLKLILNSIRISFSKIIFIDDKFKNLVDVKNVFINTDCILYNGCNYIVDKFLNSSKEEVLNEYLLFLQNEI